MSQATLRALLYGAMLLPMPVAQAQNLEWATPQSYDASEVDPAESANPILPADPTPVPIDGGLGLLGAAGAAYAIRRLRNRRTPPVGKPPASRDAAV